MWQLYCQHTYKFNGHAIDLSPFQNDGVRSDRVTFSSDGRVPGSGSLGFEDQGARVLVKPEDPKLRAVKVHVMARIRSGVNALRILVLGDYSFALGINSDGFLTGAVWQAGTPHSCISNGANAPDGEDHVVPPGRWTELGMVYDGAGDLSLSIDGRPVGQSIVPMGLPSIGGRGIAIGNAHDHPGGGPLRGEIDEITIWRFHPNSVLDEFCARPIDDATALCWEQLLGHAEQVFRNNPDCASGLRAALAAALDRALTAMNALPVSERKKLDGALKQFIDLWAHGVPAGAEMEAVLDNITSLLRSRGINLLDEVELRRIANVSCLEDVRRVADGMECDPHFRALLQLVGRSHSIFI